MVNQEPKWKFPHQGRISLDNPKSGWIDVELSNPDEWLLLQVSYLNDAPRLLLEMIINVIVKREREYTIDWELESCGTALICLRANDIGVTLTVEDEGEELYLDPDPHPDSRVKFLGVWTDIQLVNQVMNAFDHWLSVLGESGYRAAWMAYDFPRREYGIVREWLKTRD